MTRGNSRARLPLAPSTDSPGTVPRGNAVGWASGPVTTAAAAEALPLWPGAAGPVCDGEGDADVLGEGDGLGQGVLFGELPGGDTGPPGEGDLPGHGDVLGEGDGLGEGDLLGDGDGDLLGEGAGDGDLLGEGEGDGVLGEGLGAGDDLLGDGDGELAELLGEGDGDVLAAAAVPPSRTTRIPAATVAPPARPRGRAGRGRCGARPG